MSITIKPRAEEVVILALAGAAVGLAVTSPLTAGSHGWLLSDVHGLHAFLRAGIAWVSAAAGAVAGGWLAIRQERDTHLRGARYYPDFAAAKRVLQAKERAVFSQAQEAGKVRGVKVGGVEIARSMETRHMYVVGLTGSGKTVLLTSLIDQALARGDRVLVHDIKGDLTARYYDPRTCVLLGPWDQRAVVWDAALDIDSPAHAAQFAADIMDIRGGKSSDEHWPRSAAGVLGGLIGSYMAGGSDGQMRHWTWADMRAALAGDPVALVERAARGDPTVRHNFASVFPSDPERAPYIDREGQSIMSTLATRARWLLAYGQVDARDDRPQFSLRRWLTGQAHKEVRTVILNHAKIYSDVCEQLFGAILTAVAATVASPAMKEVGSDAPNAVWCILDEFPQLGSTSLAEAQSISELGRSRGMRVVFALQDESQLVAKMGREKSEPVLAQQITRVYLGSSPQTAAAVSKRIGSREIHRLENTAENGAAVGKTKRAMTTAVVTPGDITGLQVHGSRRPLGAELILHVGDVLGRLVQPFPERRPDIAEPYIESETWRRGALPDDEPARVEGDNGEQKGHEMDGQTETAASLHKEAEVIDDALPFDLPVPDNMEGHGR